MVYAIDRIDNGIAVCESLDSGEKLEVESRLLPAGAREGDVIRRSGDVFVVDVEFTEQRKQEMTERMERLFEKDNV
jgi:hypothetical protein